MLALGKTAGSPFSPLVTTSPRIDPGAAEPFWGKQRTNSTRIEITMNEILRMTVLLGGRECNDASKPLTNRRRHSQPIEGSYVGSTKAGNLEREPEIVTARRPCHVSNS